MNKKSVIKIRKLKNGYKTIFKQMDGYLENDIYPFHMPGHKGNQEYFIENLFKYDFTEIPEMDNLHDPNGMIKAAQENIAKIYKADESYFLINGSSGGILAAILAVVKKGDHVIVPRNCHKSVYNGIMLSGACPVYLMPEITPEGIPAGFDIGLLEKTILEHKNRNLKALIVTSPTYEGFVLNIGEIAKITHQHNIVLIVDEAHGAHFTFSDYFPKSAVELGADIVIQSLHKTLPMPTQTSILHVCGNRIDLHKLTFMLSVVETSSPSYLLMGYADHYLNYFHENRSLFHPYIEKLETFRSKIAHFKTIQLLERSKKIQNSIFDLDKGKLVFSINCASLDGGAVETVLKEKYKIQIEMSGYKHMVLMTSVADTELGFERLYDALCEINSNYAYSEKQLNWEPIIIPKQMMNISEAMDQSYSVIPISESEGRISSSYVIMYPPGIPLIVPGEEISLEIINKIYGLLHSHASVIGQSCLKENKITVIAE